MTKLEYLEKLDSDLQKSWGDSLNVQSVLRGLLATLIQDEKTARGLQPITDYPSNYPEHGEKK